MNKLVFNLKYDLAIPIARHGRSLEKLTRANSAPSTPAAPTAISPPSASIAENASPGALVATLSANGNPGATTFTIIDDPDDKFQIVGSQLQVRNPSDYETDNSHPVTIRADNGVGTHDQVITVTVTDVIETGPVSSITVGNVTFPFAAARVAALAEGAGIAYVVGPVTVNEPTPLQTTQSSLVINGTTIDFQFEGPTNWDQREDSEYAGPQPSYPQTLNPGQTLIKGISQPDFGGDERHGLMSEFAALVVVDSLPAANTLAPAVVSWPGRGTPQAIPHTIDAVLSSMRRYLIQDEANVPPASEVLAYIDRLNMNLAITKRASASNYEDWTPFGAVNGSNYGRYQSQIWGAAGLLLMAHSHHISDAERSRIAILTAQYGRQLYDVYEGLSGSVSLDADGGHYGFHIVAKAFYLAVTNQTAKLATLIADMPGNFAQPFIVDAAVASQAVTPHDSSTQLWTSRRRAVTLVSGTTLRVETVYGGFVNDPPSIILNGMTIVRESDGATATITSMNGALDDAFRGYVEFYIDAQPGVPFAVTDVVYFIGKYPVNTGDFEWGLRTGEIDHWYQPSPVAPYRNLNAYSATVLFLEEIRRIMGVTSNDTDALVGYTQRANQPNDPAGYDFLASFDAFPGAVSRTFDQAFWNRHSDNILGVPDMSAPVVSNIVISNITDISCAVDLNLSVDGGLITYLISSAPGLTVEEVEAAGTTEIIPVGQMAFSDSFVGMTPSTGYTFYVVYESDLGAKQLVPYTASFSTVAAPPPGVFSVDWIDALPDTSSGPYVFADVPLGSNPADRITLSGIFVRGGLSTPEVVAFDSVAAALVANSRQSDGVQTIGFWQGAPSGTTTDVDVDIGGTRCGLAGWTASKAVIWDAQSDQGSGSSVTFANVPAGAKVIAVGGYGDGPGNGAISGLSVSRADLHVESGVTILAAEQDFPAGAASLTVSVTGTAKNVMLSVVVLIEDVS